MGFYLTIEGPEATGKTTQAQLLYGRLINTFSDRPILITKEPGSQYSEVCKDIRSILLNPEREVSDKCALLLFLADRAQHINEVIKPILEQDGIVISDRSSLSTIVYHVAKLLVGTNENIPDDYFYEMLDFAQEVKPDLCLITQADFEWAQNALDERNGLDRIEGFGNNFHEYVHSLFLEIATQSICMSHPLLSRMKVCMTKFPREVVLLSKTNSKSVEDLNDEIYDRVAKSITTKDS